MFLNPIMRVIARFRDHIPRMSILLVVVSVSLLLGCASEPNLPDVPADSGESIFLPEAIDRKPYNKPYRVKGKRYVPMKTAAGYREVGVASWYGAESGNRTASGERFDPHGLTAAHKTLPIPSKVRVTNLRNGRSVEVTVNDRGPFVKGRLIDLSQGAARQIGLRGVAEVSIEYIGG
ncbi:MAG: septal ring lytic transglycosylase RlpA family protein [Gammaproteobacteria bacterium]